MVENPWLVDSIQEFWQMKCPECIYVSKEEDIFKYHAVTKHPLSLALFGKDFDYPVSNVEEKVDLIKNEVFQENNLHEETENLDTVKKGENKNPSETLETSWNEEFIIKDENPNTPG